jgi:penicillin V acylase-like amidase (Ntn superfamily)
MISTMSLNKTQGPTLDERLQFQSPFWMQYQLDMHSTVEQVIASDSEIRLTESQIGHYLVCDRKGECAAIEFLEGRLVHNTGASLPLKTLTNSTYDISLQVRDEIQQGGGEGYGNSIRRFVTVADRRSQFAPSDSKEAVDYAFDTLEAVSCEDTVWSFVYDPENLRVYFHSNRNQPIRSLDFSGLDFSCLTPVRMLDVHANVSPG